MLKPWKLYQALKLNKNKVEYLRLVGYRVYNNYLLKGGRRMIDVVKMKPNEATIVDTTNATVVVCYGGGDKTITISDINDNYIATLEVGETHTLNYNTGKYKLYYDATSQWDAIVFVVHYFSI